MRLLSTCNLVNCYRNFLQKVSSESKLSHVPCRGLRKVSWSVVENCETFRIPPLMSDRTIRMLDEGSQRRRHGCRLAVEQIFLHGLIWRKYRIFVSNHLVRSVNCMQLCCCPISKFIGILQWFAEIKVSKFSLINVTNTQNVSNHVTADRPISLANADKFSVRSEAVIILRRHSRRICFVCICLSESWSDLVWLFGWLGSRVVSVQAQKGPRSNRSRDAVG